MQDTCQTDFTPCLAPKSTAEQTSAADTNTYYRAGCSGMNQYPLQGVLEQRTSSTPTGEGSRADTKSSRDYCLPCNLPLTLSPKQQVSIYALQSGRERQWSHLL